jgi:hypothetical protein
VRSAVGRYDASGAAGFRTGCGPPTKAAKSGPIAVDLSLVVLSNDKAILLLNLDLPADFHETLPRNIE